MGRAALPVEVLRLRPCGALVLAGFLHVHLSTHQKPLLFDMMMHKTDCAPLHA